MSITHFQTGGIAAAAESLVVNLGTNKTQTGADTSSPYDSRAGFMLDNNGGSSGFIASGSNPAGGGAIVTWDDDGRIASPAGYTNSDFEYSWVEVSDDGVSAKVTPVAASTWDDFDGDKTWYATRTTSGGKTWVIDLTVREKADTSNTDTVRLTMNVEGVV